MVTIPVADTDDRAERILTDPAGYFASALATAKMQVEDEVEQQRRNGTAVATAKQSAA